MQGAKQSMPNPQARQFAHQGVHFSWATVAQGTALAASFLFVCALVFGGI